MIFGGYGRKAKHRGDVYYPCFECEALTTFNLIENYGYGQLYGVRIAKVGSNHFMLCPRCHSGYELTKEQWKQALAVSKDLNWRAHILTSEQSAHEAVRLARLLFPADAATVASALELDASEGHFVLPSADRRQLTPIGQFREPDEPKARVDVGNLIEEGLDRADGLHPKTFEPFDEARKLASEGQDSVALRQVAAALEGRADEMLHSPQGVHADGNYREWIYLFEERAQICREQANTLDKKVAESPQSTRPKAAVEQSASAEAETTAPPRSRVPESVKNAPANDPALQIVRERYARGEISREEFLQFRDDLGS